MEPFVRQELLCWDMKTGDLVKRMVAHFQVPLSQKVKLKVLVHPIFSQRIVEIKSLVVGTDNCVVTSSIDRSIKIWDLDHIFEKERHIDKHSLTIDSIRYIRYIILSFVMSMSSISTSAGIAVVVTRSCIGVWDFMTGQVYKLITPNHAHHVSR